ncbi:hypothetical protein SCLCIDRAFT_32643 [Scleroderma citrinum Foug A]|uniref:Uncharacterized protein n=1 Tax=Scleroderma citrinum Foug A TaxID=1036808 RepID=A0A0C2YRX4_9AGAM|nr:hypothetical protein SCLCIDRAFT_32643 [Scleroderma citrinum Foug A]
MDIQEQYECVSSSDYIYIMEHLESDEYRKAWIRPTKITFFLDSQSLMALSPPLLTNPPFSLVTTDGFMWFSLTSVESHLWMHNYAYRTIYLNVILDDVENTFWRILELTKVPLLTELDARGADKVLFDPMGNWPLAARVLDPEKCLHVLLEGAWATSYG